MTIKQQLLNHGFFLYWLHSFLMFSLQMWSPTNSTHITLTCLSSARQSNAFLLESKRLFKTTFTKTTGDIHLIEVFSWLLWLIIIKVCITFNSWENEKSNRQPGNRIQMFTGFTGQNKTICSIAHYLQLFTIFFPKL